MSRITRPPAAPERSRHPSPTPQTFSGVLADPGAPNANGRVYPQDVFRKAVKDLRSAAFARHPDGIGDEFIDVRDVPDRGTPASRLRSALRRIIRAARRPLERLGILKPPKISEFSRFSFPIVRRVYPNAIAHSPISVQPMTAPVLGSERRLTPAEIIARRRKDPGDTKTTVRIPSIFELTFKYAGDDGAEPGGGSAIVDDDGGVTVFRDGDATRPVRFVCAEDNEE